MQLFPFNWLPAGGLRDAGTWQDVKMNIFVSLVKITSLIIILKVLFWFQNQF